jgi:hypothetical protein
MCILVSREWAKRRVAWRRDAKGSNLTHESHPRRFTTMSLLAQRGRGKERKWERKERVKFFASLNYKDAKWEVPTL